MMKKVLLVRMDSIARIGKNLSSLAIILLILTMIVYGCSAGRGDWEYALTGGYAINRINAHGIALVRYEDSTESGVVVIPNFFVTNFCMNQNYIGIKGIQTAGMWATDEEIQSQNRELYLVNIPSGDIYGPYSNPESFEKKCDLLSVGDMGEWQSTNRRYF